jgi:YD repeat-containing protein
MHHYWTGIRGSWVRRAYRCSNGPLRKSDSRSIRNRIWAACALSTCLTFLQMMPGSVASVYAGAPSFVYDNGNRLLAAFDGNGNVANYQYDQVGNITAIVAGSASAVGVFGYSPDHSSLFSGKQVMIFGNNFSANPSQDTVTFGPAAATVISATSTTIVVSLPTFSPQTNGVGVTVTSPAGSANGPWFPVP